jgi:hypothetical protein
VRWLAMSPDMNFLSQAASPQSGDRRTMVRLEVVGELWGTFETEEAAPILEISAAGALIASPIAVALDSVQPLAIRIENESVSVQARVRHIRTLAPTDDGPLRYAVGLEFVAPPAVLAQFLSQ